MQHVRGEENYIRGFVERLSKRNHLEDLDVDESIIQKREVGWSHRLD
jgi:hypothetical protein